MPRYTPFDAGGLDYNVAMGATTSRVLIGIAALSLAAATGLGAWASHGLAASLDPAGLRSIETAIDYQFFHSLGVVLVVLCARGRQRAVWLSIAALSILTGVVLFCGGVFSSSLGGPGWIAGLAPTGGVFLIAGWLVVAAGFLTGFFGERRADDQSNAA